MLLPSLHPNAADVADLIAMGDGVLSREDLVGAATSVAERIRGAHTLAVLARPEISTTLAVVGGLIAGVTIVPVSPDAGPREQSHILTDSGAQAWLGPAPDGSELPAIPVRRYARSWHSHPEPPADAVALIMYTSGTTGAPKGVPITRRGIAAGIDALAEAWMWSATDTLAHGLPLYHVHGLILGVLGPLRLGSSLIHTGSGRPGDYAEAAESGATLFFGVPTIWGRIAADATAAAALRGARLLVSGSAALPTPVFDQLQTTTGHRAVERYGMTETLITLSARADGERRAGWVGQPLVGVQTGIRDEAGEWLPHDGESIGELLVRGPMLAAGYLGRAEATAESWLPDGWFRTGDVAVIDADGQHRIVGRSSTDLIKSGGFRIGAGEVEAALLAHRGVAEAAVVGAPDDDLGQRIVAYVVRSDADPTSIEAADLIEYVATELSHHKRPREIRFVAELPRNSMGKVQKKRLLD